MNYVTFGIVSGVAFAIIGLFGLGWIKKIFALLLLPVVLPIAALVWLHERRAKRRAQIDEASPE